MHWMNKINKPETLRRDNERKKGKSMEWMDEWVSESEGELLKNGEAKD